METGKYTVTGVNLCLLFLTLSAVRSASEDSRYVGCLMVSILDICCRWASIGLCTEFSRILEKPKNPEKRDRKTLVKVTLMMLRRQTLLL